MTEIKTAPPEEFPKGVDPDIILTCHACKFQFPAGEALSFVDWRPTMEAVKATCPKCQTGVKIPLGK